MGRYRNQEIKVMVTADEKAEIIEKMKTIKMNNISEFIRKALRYTTPLYVDTDGLKTLAYEINKVGVNLNQIAKIANTSKDVSAADIEEMKAEFKKLSDITKILYKMAGEQ